MADNNLDAELIAKLRELGMVSETLAATFKKGEKSADYQRAQVAKLAKSLIELNLATEETAQQKAEEIQRAERNADRQQKVDEQRYQAVKKFVGDVTGLAKAGISASQSMYNTDKEFTAAIPTLKLMGDAIKSITSALSGLFSGIPIIGSTLAGLDKLTSVAVDITTQVAQMQLENAQKYVDTYRSLSKVGVTFGGDIESMREAAARGGLALDQYNKFVTSNIEGLSKMGTSLQDSADRVMKMGKSALDTNKKLLTIYGGYEEVNTALATYATTMAMYGVDTVKNQKALEAGSASYLTTLKTLQAVTGKSAEAYKSDQEKRAKHAAYLMKIQEVAAKDPGLAEALKRTVYLATQMYGEDAGNRLEERIAQSTDALALNGQAISAASLKFESFSGAASKATDDMLEAAVRHRGSDQAAIEAQARIIRDSTEGVKADAQANREVARVAYAAQNETVQKIAANIAEQLGRMDKTANIVDAVNESYKQFNKTQTEGSKGFNGAIDALKDYKIRMDELVAKSLPKVAEMATGLIKLQENLVTTFTDLGGAVNLATGAFNELVGALNKALGKETPEEKVAAETGSVPRREEDIRKQRAAVAKERYARDQQQLAARKAYVENAVKAGTSQKEAQAQAVKYFPVSTGADEIARAVAKANTQGRAKVSSDLEAALPELLAQFPGAKISSLTTGKHAEASKHYEGRAVDFTIPDYDAKRSDEYKQILKDIGFKMVKDEYKERSADWSGNHIHAELAKGGITSGPSIAGEAGPEAVIPLPDGRNIPVKVDNSAVIDKLEEMISLLKDQRDISVKQLWAAS